MSLRAGHLPTALSMPFKQVNTRILKLNHNSNFQSCRNVQLPIDRIKPMMWECVGNTAKTVSQSFKLTTVILQKDINIKTQDIFDMSGWTFELDILSASVHLEYLGLWGVLVCQMKWSYLRLLMQMNIFEAYFLLHIIPTYHSLSCNNYGHDKHIPEDCSNDLFRSVYVLQRIYEGLNRGVSDSVDAHEINHVQQCSCRWRGRIAPRHRLYDHYTRAL